MKSGDENNLVPISKLILQLPFKLPVRIINQDQNTWPPKIVRNQPLTRIRAKIQNPKKKTYTPSPSPNITSRSLNKFSFIHLTTYRIFNGSGGVVPGTKRGR